MREYPQPERVQNLTVFAHSLRGTSSAGCINSLQSKLVPVRLIQLLHMPCTCWACTVPTYAPLNEKQLHQAFWNLDKSIDVVTIGDCNLYICNTKAHYKTYRIPPYLSKSLTSCLDECLQSHPCARRPSLVPGAHSAGVLLA